MIEPAQLGQALEPQRFQAVLGRGEQEKSRDQLPPPLSTSKQDHLLEAPRLAAMTSQASSTIYMGTAC